MNYDKSKYKIKKIRRKYKTKSGETKTKVYYYLVDKATKKMTRFKDNYESRKSTIYATADGKKTKAYNQYIADIKNDSELTAAQKQQLISDFNDALGIAVRRGIEFTDARWESSKKENAIERYLYNFGVSAEDEAEKYGLSKEDFLNPFRWTALGDGDYIFEWQGRNYQYEWDYDNGVVSYEVKQ